MVYDIKNLSLEEKIGQMLIVGFEGKKITQRNIDQIQKYKVGGIILYKRNFDSYEQMLEIIKQLRELNKINKIPLFIAVDQEGGRVNRIPKEFLNIPAPYKVYEKLGEEGIKKASLITAEILKKSGYNMNFAPNLDIYRFEENRVVVGDRSFSKDINIITKMGMNQFNIYKSNGIIPVIKHFPGHGAAKSDSHYFSPKIKFKFEELLNSDLKPFGELIKNGAECVLVGHLRIKNKTRYIPCSLSREFIIKELRRRFNFKGLVISDDLKMRAIQNIYGYEKAALKAIQAGNDIIMFRYPEFWEKITIKKLVHEAKNKKIKPYYIDKSVKKILELKEKYNLTDIMPKEKIDIDGINKQIQEIRNIVYGENLNG